MISVYNIARSESVEQLNKKNRDLKILKIIIISSLIVTVIGSIGIESAYYLIDRPRSL